MANLSNLTRKDQVLRYLQEHDGWVDGPELANEKVGGSEGLKRVRELRAEGHRIITRPHPDRSRDIFQYKLVKPESIHPVIQHRLDELSLGELIAAGSPLPEQAVSGPLLPEPSEPQPLTPAGRPFPIRMNKETGMVELTREVCVECGGMYDDDLEHRTTDPRHLRWMEQEQKRTEGQLTVGVPEQPPPYRFSKMPERLDLSRMTVCPRCRGYRRAERKYFSRKKGDYVVTPAEDFTRDPMKPTIKGEPNPCPRCGGFGIIPIFVDETTVPIRS